MKRAIVCSRGAEYKMAIDQLRRTAWSICSFCSRTDDELISILRDSNRWKELPLSYACAWRRTAQLRTHLRGPYKGMWAGLCARRAQTCNRPSCDWTPSEWGRELLWSIYLASDTALEGFVGQSTDCPEIDQKEMKHRNDIEPILTGCLPAMVDSI